METSPTPKYRRMRTKTSKIFVDLLEPKIFEFFGSVLAVIIMFGRRRGYRRGFGGGGGGGLGMVLLAMQLVHLFQFLSSSNGYYPVTLGVLGLNLITFFRPGRNWPSIQQACISVRGAWFDREWSRVFLASFYHTSDFHLYYNMASFIWKAISLESHFGSGYFLYMVAVFSIATNLLYVAMNFALAEILDQWSYINSCAVGFSGVLFALKVVTTHIQPAGMTRVMGFIPVPMRIACWVELVLISVLLPHVSFVGHLAGILIGFAYVYGPLKTIMNVPLSLITDLVPSGGTGGRGGGGGGETGRANSYTYTAGTTGRRGANQQQQQQRPAPRAPPPDTREYHSYTYASGTSGRREEDENEEVELQEAIRRSMQPNEETSTSDEVKRDNIDSEPSPPNPPPPPYNPDYSTDGSSPEVGWNRDLLERNDDEQTASARPLGFEGLYDDLTDHNSSTGTGLRHRRNETQNQPPNTESDSEEWERGEQTLRRESGGLTREEMREARLLRLGRRGGGGGGGVRERRPLSDLSGHSFSFRK